MPDQVSIEGIDEVFEFLTKSPRLAVATGLVDALTAASKPIDEALAFRVPHGQLTADTKDTLAESQVTEIVLDADLQGGFVEIGFGKQSRIANWVEFGHRIVVKGERQREYYVAGDGKVRTRKISRSGGSVPPYPFIRPAFEDSADAAVEAFGESISRAIKAQMGSEDGSN